MLLARFTGMAKPRPMLPAIEPRGLKLAVLMPISSPLRLTSAPPELPGLMLASVWMKFWKPAPGRLLRPTAEMIPLVTVWPTPNGLPIATTKSPICRRSLFAIGIAVRSCAGIRIRATSVSGSEPTNSARRVRPSARFTETSSASSTTWLLVSTSPRWASMITPEPSDWAMRSCGIPNMRRNTGSSPNGVLTRTRCLLVTLTTAGRTFFSIGASEGTGTPLTAVGSAAAAGTVAAPGGGCAPAGASSIRFRPVAAKPPNAAAAVRASRVRRAVLGACCIAGRLRDESGGCTGWCAFTLSAGALESSVKPRPDARLSGCPCFASHFRQILALTCPGTLGTFDCWRATTSCGQVRRTGPRLVPG